MIDKPYVSVIMPIRNEASFIGRSLGAVMAQDYPPDRLEILVVDGMSTDETRGIVESLQTQQACPIIRLLDNPAKIVPAGINQGLRVASGDVIVRVDGHTEIAPDYVRQCVTVLKKSGADNVGGKMTAVGVTPFGEAVSLATSAPFGVGGAKFHYSDQEEWVDTVYLGAWPRDVFQRIGYFDEELVRDQDDEFNYRLREYDGRILLSPQIKSVYTVRSTARSLWRQYFQYGFWKIRVLQKHPSQMQPRQFAPPFLAAILIFFTLTAPFTRLARWLLALVVVVYGIVNLLSSVLLAAHKGWKHLWRLPQIFTILHIGYGTGFLAGLIRFADRWGDENQNFPLGENRIDDKDK